MVLFESAGLLTEENKEIIAFGLERLYGFVTSLAFSVVCAGLMGDFFAGVLFESAYIMLRRFAGGYHAKNKRNCLILTYVSALFCIIAIFVVPISKYVMNVMMCLFNFVFWKYAPVQSENKPLNSMEQKVYRRKSVHIAAMETVLYFILMWLGLELYAKALFFSMLMIAVGSVKE